MTPEELCEALGRHPITDLILPGCDPGGATALPGEGAGEENSPFGDGDLDRWLVICCLMGSALDASQLAASAKALETAGLATPGAIAKAGGSAIELALVAAQHPKAEASANLLARVAAALEERYGGSLAALGREADDLEDLAGRLLGLASGFGRAAVLRLLRPLRGVWPLADEVPLDPRARAAALHLGWIQGSEDEEGAPGALRRRLRCFEVEGRNPTQLCDVEAALERLGRASCLRERGERCPLGSRCPQRTPCAD
jgi:hypothetical protein